MGIDGSELMRRGDSSPVPIDHGAVQSDAMGTALERAAEAGTAQLEAQARALVQARFFVAKQPHMMRSWDQVEQRLRKECARPGFAQAAWWTLPYNPPVEGLSIRFAEAALRLSGNIDVQQQTIFDDAWKRIVRVTVMDLETNFAYTSEVAIEKTVERSQPKDRTVLSVRENSAGKLVYRVEATEQELAQKQGSVVSKAIRTLGLRLIPGDIIDECKAIIAETRAKGTAAEDPEQARKVILDSFAEIGVMPADLARYLEHDTNSFLPAERDALRGIYTAIKNGIGTWRDVIEAKFGSAEPVEESAGAKKIKDALAKRKPPASTAPAPTPSAAIAPAPAPGPVTAPAPLKPPTHLEEKSEWPDPEDPANEPWIKYQGKLYHNASGEIGGYREYIAPEKPKERRAF